MSKKYYYEWDVEKHEDWVPYNGTCDSCEQDRPVVDMVDPYEYELDGIETDITICLSCYEHRRECI